MKRTTKNSIQIAPSPTYLSDISQSSKPAQLGLGDSRLALGTAGLGGGWGPIDESASVDAILFALEAGLSVFDTAPVYSKAERILGRALAQWKGPRPIVSTKVGRLHSGDAFDGGYDDYSPEGMRQSVGRSLELLGLDSVDLLFLHNPEKVPTTQRASVLETMVEFKSRGLARYLGLGGGFGKGWDDFLESGSFNVVIIYNRLDACCFDGISEDISRVRRIGAMLYGASPLHMGLLGDRFEEFRTNRPDWIRPNLLQVAARIKMLADENGMDLSSLAHRFLFSVGELDRILLGACTLDQFKRAWRDWNQVPLPESLFRRICEAVQNA